MENVEDDDDLEKLSKAETISHLQREAGTLVESKPVDPRAAKVASIRNFDSEPSGEDDSHDAEWSLQNRRETTNSREGPHCTPTSKSRRRPDRSGRSDNREYHQN